MSAWLQFSRRIKLSETPILASSVIAPHLQAGEVRSARLTRSTNSTDRRIQLMKKILAISFCAVCLCLAGVASRTHGGGSDSKASFERWIEQANKAQTTNDAKWMEANLASG